jgi:hypothetical protein
MPVEEGRSAAAVGSTETHEAPCVHIHDLPASVLRHVLLGGTHRHLLCFVSRCALVCSEWRRLVHGAAPYGIDIKTPAPTPAAVYELLCFCKEASVATRELREEQKADGGVSRAQCQLGHHIWRTGDWFATEELARCELQRLIKAACSDTSRPDIRFVVRRSLGLRDQDELAFHYSSPLPSHISVTPRMLEALAAGLLTATRAYVLSGITAALEGGAAPVRRFGIDMPIGDAGVAALAAAVQASPIRIDHIKLANSGVTPAGICTLGPALACLRTDSECCYCEASKGEPSLCCIRCKRWVHTSCCHPEALECDGKQHLAFQLNYHFLCRHCCHAPREEYSHTKCSWLESILGAFGSLMHTTGDVMFKAAEITRYLDVHWDVLCYQRHRGDNRRWRNCLNSHLTNNIKKFQRPRKFYWSLHKWSGPNATLLNLAREDMCCLDMSSNPGLGNEGLVVLAEFLPPTLCSIDISHTDCGDRGFATIVATLPALPCLREFRCSNNPAIGIEGWMALKEVLPQLNALRRIVGVPPAAMAVLELALMACPHIDVAQ